MKVLIRATEDIFCMSKLTKKYAMPDIVDLIGQFVYFSECNSTHGPRIKFYGGSKETATTKNAPSLAFDVNGNCVLELADWMNKKNCPNAYDDEYITKLATFVKQYLPILLLVWFGHLDEADALQYFQGNIPISELIADIEYDIPDKVTNLVVLDHICRENNYYQF